MFYTLSFSTDYEWPSGFPHNGLQLHGIGSCGADWNRTVRFTHTYLTLILKYLGHAVFRRQDQLGTDNPAMKNMAVFYGRHKNVDFTAIITLVCELIEDPWHPPVVQVPPPQISRGVGHISDISPFVSDFMIAGPEFVCGAQTVF